MTDVTVVSGVRTLKMFIHTYKLEFIITLVKVENNY